MASWSLVILLYADVAFDGYLPPSFPECTWCQGCRCRVHDNEQRLQHGRLACWLLLWQSRRVRALGTIKTYYDYGMFQAIQIAAIMALRHTMPRSKLKAKSIKVAAMC